MNIGKKDIDIFRKYLLSPDEDARQSIRASLSDKQLKFLSIIETGFLQNTSLENIASQIEATHLILDLKQLQTEYYLYLEEMYEKEIKYAITDIERSDFKKKLELTDLKENLQVYDSEIKSAIIQVQRETIKLKLKDFEKKSVIRKLPAPFIITKTRLIRYASAAAVIGVVFGAWYFITSINNRQKSKSVTKNEEGSVISNSKIITKLPAIKENVSEKYLRVPVTYTIYGFTEREPKIYTIITYNIQDQIDTLKIFYSSELSNNTGANTSPLANIISQKIDSLLSIRGTYTYDSTNRKITIALNNNQKVGDIISIDPFQNNDIFIKLQETYYKLKPTSIPINLTPVKNQDTINIIKNIVFQNF